MIIIRRNFTKIQEFLATKRAGRQAPGSGGYLSSSVLELTSSSLLSLQSGKSSHLSSLLIHSPSPHLHSASMQVLTSQFFSSPPSEQSAFPLHLSDWEMHAPSLHVYCETKQSNNHYNTYI